MRYLTGYYFCANLHSALVLQQVTRRKGKLPIVFACVWEDGCREEGRLDVAQDMTEWFYGKALSLCSAGKQADCVNAVQRNFTAEADGVRGDFAVLFAVGEECFYAWRGRVEMHLLNRCFNRLNRKRLTYLSEELCMERGRIEEGVGLLLGSAQFFAKLPEKLMKECLEIDALQSADRVERHLREAAEAARQRGAEELAMILVVAQGE